VDDKPLNNSLEMQALNAMGFNIRTVTTTDNAIADLRSSHFDIVISDMKRGDIEDAGYDLLGLTLALPIIPPLIFYTRSKLDLDVAITRGAFGVATKASDLVLLVKSAVSRNGSQVLSRANYLTYWRNNPRKK
jgi:CheY-like chemotaxis protein